LGLDHNQACSVGGASVECAEVPDRLVDGVGHMHRGQIAAAQVAGQRECIAPVGLDVQ
jgi:hypothetical protein